MGKIAKENNLMIHTHLSENPSEIELVKHNNPDCPTYSSVYEKHNLLTDKSVFAHCIHLEDEEIDLIKESSI